MRLLPFKALFPNLDAIPSVEHYFKYVKNDFTISEPSHYLNQVDKSGFYIYQITSLQRTYFGIISCVDIQDFVDQKIMMHEKTIQIKEEKQMQLMEHRRAAVKPVLLTYPTVKDIEDKILTIINSEPSILDFRIPKTNDLHSFWFVSNEKDLNQFKFLFRQNVPKSYIADGHHRTSASFALANKNGVSANQSSYRQLLCCFFSSNQLEILEFNRLVGPISNFPLDNIVNQISEVCEIQEAHNPFKPARKHELIMFFGKKRYRLNWKPAILDKLQENIVATQDAALLNRYILQDLLGIKDERNDPRIAYMEGPKGVDALREKVVQNDNYVGFVLYPLQMEELFALSDSKYFLPPKTTWFEPRMKNGLIVLPYK